ncbi:MAG: twin-arginine translocase TatA/TatE family subunit [Alicyclobacillus sp.]|nr:twin-arginine translocase TatA/TatE family subunit [Alicyclobacillus sp.]
MSLLNPGPSGLLLIVIVLLLVFGPSKLPEIGKAFGRGLREFKDATRGIMDDGQNPPQEARKQDVHTPAVEPIVLKAEEQDPPKQ